MTDKYHLLSIEGKFLHNCYTIQRNLPKRPTTSLMAYETLRATNRAKDLSTLVFFIPEVLFCVDYEDKMRKQKSEFSLIEYKLSENELSEFDKWVEKHKTSPVECFSDIAQRDYKVSFTFVENSEAWCVSLTGKEGAKFNEKCTLTTWGDDPIEALYLAVFKAGVIFGWGVWKTRNESRRG